MLTLVALTGCGGSAFSLGPDFADDSGVGEDVAKLDGNDAGTQTDADASKPPPDASQTVTDADAGEMLEAAMREDSAPDAPVSACTCDDAGSSCFYSVSEPPSGYGVPYLVTTVKLTPSSPTATFTATVASEPQPYHNIVWYDLDLGEFVNGGTIYIQGQVGDGSCSASSYLMTQCGIASGSGSFPFVEGIGGVINGTWTFPSYQFPADTTVLHFGTEGGWSTATNTTNTNKVTVLVQP